jgi:hypothetical protein
LRRSCGSGCCLDSGASRASARNAGRGQASATRIRNQGKQDMSDLFHPHDFSVLD